MVHPIPTNSRDDQSLFEEIQGDGRMPIFITGLALAGSGGFALFQSFSGHFLPQDTQALGMDAATLRNVGGNALVGFMFHDRVSFGGVLIGIGTLYGWIAGFPLRDGEGWAWWALLISGITGFGSFLAYLGYGYLDTWHGAATLLLLPVYGVGVWRTRRLRGRPPWDWLLFWNQLRISSSISERWGRFLLSSAAIGMTGAGLVIMGIGMTTVFVPQDLSFIGRTREAICGLNPHLVPVIAHDRAGFGGGLVSIGLLLWMMASRARLSRHLAEALGIVGLSGFGTTLGVHVAIGYLNAVHILPAILGAIVYGLAWGLLAIHTISKRTR